MKPVRFIVLIIFALLCSTNEINAQDTFYVKKKNPPVVEKTKPAWDTNNNDSIISYTIEYRQPGSNIWVVLHQQGPHFNIPYEAINNRERVLITDIMRMDSSGRIYRQPDQYFMSGVFVPVQAPKK